MFPVWERAFPRKKALFEGWERQITEMTGLGTAFLYGTLCQTILEHQIRLCAPSSVTKVCLEMTLGGAQRTRCKTERG